MSESDDLREALAGALGDAFWNIWAGDRHDPVDALLPIVTAYAESQSRARAAAELQAAADAYAEMETAHGDCGPDHWPCLEQLVEDVTLDLERRAAALSAAGLQSSTRGNE